MIKRKYKQFGKTFNEPTQQKKKKKKKKKKKERKK